jgi:hypothetical protein
MLGKNFTERGRKTTKISIFCDEDRIILGHIATPCGIDVKVVETTLDSVPFDLQKLQSLTTRYRFAVSVQHRSRDFSTDHISNTVFQMGIADDSITSDMQEILPDCLTIIQGQIQKGATVMI